MDIANLFRSFIFLTAGVALIFFQKKVVKFQTYLLKIVRIKRKIVDYERPYKISGILFVIIAIILFAFSVNWLVLPF